KRGVSESFWVITGTTSCGELSRDLLLASRSTATVVLLMATRKLPDIVKVYKDQNQGEKPIAVIQSGTTCDEKVIAGTMMDIEMKAYESGIGSPAIIIVGDVVKESPQLLEVYREVAYASKLA
ncbi:MAG: SAM-dependent methyltransferase, partial [Cyclobacteriaceae bacterium]